MVGVSAPGRWMLAMASRSAVVRDMRQPPRDRHQQRRDEPQRHEHGGGRADEDRRDPAVVGQQDRGGGERARPPAPVAIT